MKNHGLTVRHLKIVCIAILATSIGALGLVTALQRSLLFSTDDGGALAAANWRVIEGEKKFAIKTTDGEKLAAWYMAPKPGRPVFLFFHRKGGGLHRKKWRWRRLKKAGAGVLVISYRGYPGSTGSPSESGLIEDARAAYRWLNKKHSEETIVIHGLSLGTGVATALATEVSAKALVLEAPFSAARDVAAERYPFLPVDLLMRDPFLSRERIGQIDMPLLIAHGTHDTVIPVVHAKRLFERALEPKQLLLMDGSDHSTLVRDGLYPKIWAFLASLPLVKVGRLP